MNAISETPNSNFVVLKSSDQIALQDGQFLVAPMLTQALHTIYKRKRLVIGIVIACLALGLLVTLLTAPTYTATSQIEISRAQKKVTNVEGLESVQAGQDLEFYETQYALLQSQSLAERVANQLNVNASNDLFDAAGFRVDATKLGDPKAGPLTKLQIEARSRSATKLLRQNIEIDPVRRSRLVAISYTSRSPELSARIANLWTQQFISASMDREFASTADARKFLENRLAALKVKLEESERATVNYATDKSIVALETVRDQEGKTQGQRTLAAADLENLSAALNQAVADRIAAQSRIGDGRGDLSPEALSNTAISELRRQRGEAAAEYAKLLVQFEPDYPAARALDSRVRTEPAAWHILRPPRRAASEAPKSPRSRVLPD